MKQQQYMMLVQQSGGSVYKRITLTGDYVKQNGTRLQLDKKKLVADLVELLLANGCVFTGEWLRSIDQDSYTCTWNIQALSKQRHLP